MGSEEFQTIVIQELRGINQRLDRVDQRLDKVDQRLDKVDQRLDKLEQRMDKLEQRMDKLENRMDKLENRMDNLESRMDNLENRMERLEQRVDNVEVRMDKLDNRMDKLDQRLDEQRVVLEGKIDECIRIGQHDLMNLLELIHDKMTAESQAIERLSKTQTEQAKVLNLLSTRSIKQEADIEYLKGLRQEAISYQKTAAESTEDSAAVS